MPGRVVTANEIRASAFRKTVVDSLQVKHLQLDQKSWMLLEKYQVLEAIPCVLVWPGFSDSTRSNELLTRFEQFLGALPRARMKEQFYLALPSAAANCSSGLAKLAIALDLVDIRWISRVLSDPSSAFPVRWIALQMLKGLEEAYVADDIRVLTEILSSLESAFPIRAKRVERKGFLSVMRGEDPVQYLCACGAHFSSGRCGDCGRDPRGLRGGDFTPEQARSAVEHLCRLLQECLLPAGPPEVGRGESVANDNTIRDLLKGLSGMPVAINSTHPTTMAPAQLIAALGDYFIVTPYSSGLVVHHPYSTILSVITPAKGGALRVEGVDVMATVEVQHVTPPSKSTGGGSDGVKTVVGVGVTIPLDWFSS